MNSMRLLSRGLMLAALILILASCTSAQSPQAKTTPTKGTTPTLPLTPQPTITPTPVPTRPAPLGLAPQNCPSSPALKKINTSFTSLVGTAPAWVNSFIEQNQQPVLLFGDNHTMYSWVQYDEHGWEHKFLYAVGPSYTGIVTFHGTNLRDGTPLWLVADNVPATTTSLVLNPGDPTVVNRPGDWVEFPGGLDIPKAGCYFLQADWTGGSWRMIFSAGV